LSLEKEFQVADNCYDPKLITGPKTSHIQIISIIFPTQAITIDPGKLVGSKTVADLAVGLKFRPKDAS
jgi:hypothetical protein